MYTSGAMGLVMDSETKASRIVFRFPDGLDAKELIERIEAAEKNSAGLLSE